MHVRWHPSEIHRVGRYLLVWLALASAVGGMAGSASALFLFGLDAATQTRLDHPWLLYLLPLGGLAIGFLYHRWGRGLEGGNNLLLDEIHQPRSGVPARLAPTILLATLGTHLFGGSAGREGTAVQMGGSLAGWLGRRLRLDAVSTRKLLLAGISAGFGSVFGTPLAGAVFGLEVLVVGQIRYDALIPCLVASLVGDWTCTACGVSHAHYHVANVLPATPWVVGRVAIAGIAFGLAAAFFAERTHALGRGFQRWIAWPPARPFFGGLLVIALTWLVGTRDYLGLGLPMLARTLEPGGVATWAFLWKIAFTAVTLGAGFKGGEVTPLFLIGAALGCTLAGPLGLPTDFVAALGFVAVFAAAANTPIACSIMGVELFGSALGVPLAVACCVAYVASGHRGIYGAQRVDAAKGGRDHPGDATLAEARRG